MTMTAYTHTDEKGVTRVVDIKGHCKGVITPRMGQYMLEIPGLDMVFVFSNAGDAIYNASIN
jgi:hypothetical protein